MNRIYLVLLCSILLFASSCVKSDGDENMPTAGSEYLEVSDKLVIEGETTSATLSIDASSNCNWTVSCSDALVSNISPSSGKGASSVTITTTANPTALSSRSASIVVKNNSGSIVREITFTQSASKEIIDLSVTSIELTSKGETRNVTISSNTHWTITGGADWITLNKTEGDNNGDVSITIAENTSKEDREAVLTVTGKNGTTKTISIKQIRATFTTISVPQISDVTGISAKASFSYESNKEVTTYGVCYSTADNITVENATIISLEGTDTKGSPTIQLTDLTAGTTYFVRAYVIDADGIKYSNSVSFNTANSWPGENDNNLPNI